LLDLAGKIPGIGKPFRKAADFARGFKDGLDELIETQKKESQIAIDTAKAKQDAIERGAIDEIKAIEAKKQARLEALEQLKKQNEEEKKLIKEKQEAQKEQSKGLKKFEGLTVKWGKRYEELVALVGKESADAFVDEQKRIMKQRQHEIISKVKDVFKNIGSAIQKTLAVTKIFYLKLLKA
jgi:hypothetical protein